MAIQYQAHALRAYLQTVIQELSYLDIDVRLIVHGKSDEGVLITELDCDGEISEVYRFYELMYEVEDTLGRYYRQQGTHSNIYYYLFSPMVDELITEDEIGLPRGCLRQDQEYDEAGISVDKLIRQMGCGIKRSVTNYGFQTLEFYNALHSTLPAPPDVRQTHLPKERVLQRLHQILDELPKDISQDPRVIAALLELSPLEQKFLTVLAVAGDGIRVSTDDLANKCWGGVPTEEAIRSVYRSIQIALVNSLVVISNARKGYKITLKK